MELNRGLFPWRDTREGKKKIAKKKSLTYCLMTDELIISKDGISGTVKVFLVLINKIESRKKPDIIQSSFFYVILKF